MNRNLFIEKNGLRKLVQSETILGWKIRGKRTQNSNLKINSHDRERMRDTQTYRQAGCIWNRTNRYIYSLRKIF